MLSLINLAGRWSNKSLVDIFAFHKLVQSLVKHNYSVVSKHVIPTMYIEPVENISSGGECIYLFFPD